MYSNLESNSEDAWPRYKKPLVFFLSLASIVGIVLIIVFVLLGRTGNDKVTITKLPFTLNSVFNSSLSPKSFSLQWGGNGQFYIYQNTSVSSDWLKFDLATKTSSLYINATDLQQIVPDYSSYAISYDGAYLLFAINASSVWRHSILAIYKIYSVADNTVRSLVDGDPLLQNVVWNPVNHEVAFVLNNNIYVTDTSTQNPPIAVTTDGDAAGGILNGIQSWVYEEEVFSDFNAMWWSNDGSYLAYLRFNESEVPIFYYTTYAYPNAYPTQIPLRYPKAGYANPQVRVQVYSVATGSSAGFPYLEYGVGGLWEYVASVQWGSNSVLWVQQLNRYQNTSSIQALSFQGDTWVNETAYTQTSLGGWVNVHPFTFCQIGGTPYNFLILPHNDYYHIAVIQQVEGEPTFLTEGQFNVISISGCSVDGRIYYLATEPMDETLVGPTLQHIYTVDLQSRTTRVGWGNGVFSASFSPLGDYFLMRYLGPEVPQVFFVSSDGTYNVTLVDNRVYAETIAQYDLPQKTYTTVLGASGEMLNAYYKKPAQAKSGHPLIIDVYAGPGTQKVRQVHDVAGLDAWLCSQGYIVAAVDGRGTGGRSIPFMQATYRQLTLLETADQRSGAKHLSEKISAVDSSRVGIWGWSYGGCMAAHGSADTSALAGFKYKAAVSVAPVTDWSLYDSIYTERFMSTPADNPIGYNSTSVIQHASTISSNTLLLMHGLADDNVHFQNTAEFVSALIQSNVQFDTMFYPNNNHAINSGNARMYLYEKMIDYLNSHL